MELLAAIAALIGVLAAGIIYGTDAFCAPVLRPALAEPDDRTMAAVMGACTSTATAGCRSRASSASSPRSSPRRDRKSVV